MPSTSSDDKAPAEMIDDSNNKPNPALLSKSSFFAGSLPLDWTRVKRKRSSQNIDSEDCNCDDPLLCQMGKQHRRPRAPLSSATVAAAAAAAASSSSSQQQDTVSYRGTAIVCLHESNPDWFQGYFIPQQQQQQQVAKDEDITTTTNINNNLNPTNTDSSSHASSFLSSHTTTTSSAWGLLGQQQEIDECLQCADGGYRELKLTVYPYNYNYRNNNYNNYNYNNNNNKIVISNVEWTGGDMMRLLQPEGRVRLEPQQLWTEEQAVPFCKRFFGGLLRRLQEQQDKKVDDDNDNAVNNDQDHNASSQEEKDRVLQLIPDVAIIVGAMEVRLAKRGEQGDE